MVLSQSRSPALESAWEILEHSIIYYEGKPVGTVAAQDPNVEALNYDQCFVRDFVSSALVFLMQGRTDIVRNFLIATLKLQSHEKQMDCFQPGPGLMPASFKVIHEDGQDRLVGDFGEHAIARVPPVDSCLWWVLLLRAYCKAIGDFSLAHQPDFQEGIRLILDMCLVHRFAMYPTMLVPDGCCMIDRRMGVYGHPLEIQVLFYAVLKASQELLLPDGVGDSYRHKIQNRSGALHYHVREYYWLDLKRLREIYRYRGEEFGLEIANTFNIYPESIPAWLTDWLPEKGGYLAGNLGPGQMDFHFFALGNLLAMVVSLASPQESQAIMTLFEQRWQDLMGYMPVKLFFPALEGEEWRIVTGCDPKNRPWSYHNGGNWPVLLWLFTAAAQKTGRIDLAERAIALARERLIQDHFPEYYDGSNGRLIGQEARLYQTWSIAGLLVAHLLLENPDHLGLISLAESTGLSTCQQP